MIRFHNVHLFAFAFPFLVVLAFLCVVVVTGGIVVGSSTWSPAIFRPMSSSATVLARRTTEMTKTPSSTNIKATRWSDKKE